MAVGCGEERVASFSLSLSSSLLSSWSSSESESEEGGGDLRVADAILNVLLLSASIAGFKGVLTVDNPSLKDRDCIAR